LDLNGGSSWIDSGRIWIRAWRFGKRLDSKSKGQADIRLILDLSEPEYLDPEPYNTPKPSRGFYD
jgi:hypothetical protein